MSINVTVSGNPISIKRGRMVTCDSYQAKKEFEKRRLMRLEQVRQQSKDIAENVRNKVRKEKKKQIQQIEEEGKQKLKNWQNRKLIELQTQYEEALHELGTGHKEAIEFEDESEILDEQKEERDKVATHRGHVAATKLQIEKNKENIKKAIPIQQKKLVRDIENTRASLVTSIKKSKTAAPEPNNKTRKRRKPVSDTSLIIPSSSSESSERSAELDAVNGEHDQLINIEEKEESGSSCDCTDASDIPRQPLNLEANTLNQNSVQKSHDAELPKSRDQGKLPSAVNLAKQISDRRKLIEEFRQQSSNISPPLDTRISDRIKRREFMASQPDYCDTVAKTHPTPFIESNTQLREAIHSHNVNSIPAEIHCVCGHKCPDICGNKLKNKDGTKHNENYSRPEIISKNSNVEINIPEKPPIMVKDRSKVIIPSKDTLETYDSHKVKFYDHPNRFSQEKRFPSNTHVEKITADSLEVIPNVISETEWQEKMKQRDRDAQMRGRKALEKEKVQRDYEEMLKKLPLLQKKERISEITKDKPEYHMSDDRLKEKDRKKQNEIDNAYSKLFPNLKPAVVTLPSNKHEDIRKLPVEEPVQSLNVGNWDVDDPEQKMFTVEEVQEIVKAFTEQKPKDRRAKLKQLLKSLKLQKEQLINEIKSLPSNDSINELISDLKSFSDDEKNGSRYRKKQKSERKRRREEHDKESPTESTPESSSSSVSSTEKEEKSKGKHKNRYHSDTRAPSPRKKPKIKSRRKVLILQNMSTQTTPKVSSNSDQDKPKTNDELKDTAKCPENYICPKLHIPCDCNKDNQSTDELCQIVIKINDNEDPEVIVKSKEKDVKSPESAIKENKIKETSKFKKTDLKSIGVGTDDIQDTENNKKTVHSRVSSNITHKKAEDKSKRDQMKKQKSDVKMDKVDSKVSQTDTIGSKAKSWREQLSKHSISTSSTSYFSPPDFLKAEDSQGQSSINGQSKQSLYNLRKKPQQLNLEDISSALNISPCQSLREQQSADHRLAIYIQKLLSMSRGSIENLTVSTSSVQTPSQSVIEMESNNPLSHLHNTIKYLALKDVDRELSLSPDYSSVHYNSSASTPEDSKQQPTHEKSTDQFSKSGKTDRSSKGTIEKETNSSSARSKDSVLAQYADITDSCSKRIAQLAAMIEQLRQEKIQMLQHPPATHGVDKEAISNDKDHSTAYLDLPGSNDSSSKFSSLNSLDDEEMQRKLLEIDFSLAEKLRKFSLPSKDKASDADHGYGDKPGLSKDASNETNTTNTELWSRLKRLTEQEEQAVPKPSTTHIQKSKNSVTFVPFLSDIPMLPKLEAQPENSSGRVDSNLSSNKRPPPSKGLSVAKKFNGNISLIPHELSTIVEADSQLSTKIGSANNSKTSQDISPQKDFQLVVQPEVIGEEDKTSVSTASSNKSSPTHLSKISLTAKQKCDDKCTNECLQIVPVDKSNKRKFIKRKTPPSSPLTNFSSDDTNQSLIVTCSKSSKKSIQLSSSSSDDMESIEAMLRSIGMEWAIPTLHKTKEALALTSSSSSLELSSKKHTSQDVSASEVSLKQFLKKQIKISSSTLKSDMSPASFSGDLSELSSIQVNNSNVDKSNQRTSTPIISSKSTEVSERRVIFSGDSDISSVRGDTQKHSDKSSKNSYRSLSEYSQSKSDV